MVNLKKEDPVHGLESLPTSKLLFIFPLSLSLWQETHKCSYVLKTGGFCVSVSKAVYRSVHVQSTIQTALSHQQTVLTTIILEVSETVHTPETTALVSDVCLVACYIQSHISHKSLPSLLNSVFRSDVFTSIILCLCL
jgi:hypothetical protein